MVSDSRMKASARSIIPLIRAHSAIESPSHPINLESLRLSASDRGSQMSLKAGEYTGSNGIPTYHIDISLRGAEVSHAELATLCENFSMKSLLSLEVMLDDSSPWDLAVLHRLFKSAEKVHTISASGPSAMALCSALIEPLPCSSSKQSSSSSDAVKECSTSSDLDGYTLLFPLLLDLHLLRIHGDGEGEEMYDVAMWIEDRDSLAPISKLQISDCTLSEDCVDMLEDIDGLEVVWDGSYGRFYEDDEEEWLGCGCCGHGHGGCSSDGYDS
ncbi:hypothetical protein PENSPDRAFT_645833 [Peniophora sp. CONT]|nr:hypothetical protein PENSPDRAFT_645833 [Peniophora sp. CONT]